MYHFQKYNPEKKDWNHLQKVRSSFRLLTFRSTIQRRRIETRLATVRLDDVTTFQKYNPEKKDWNFYYFPYYYILLFFQKYNPEKKDWNSETEDTIIEVWRTFRSTIQRRRIETFSDFQNPLLSGFFQKYNPEKKDWNRWEGSSHRYCVSHFQKYNPEKKDWNMPSPMPIWRPRSLSEVQSREEGLKHIFRRFAGLTRWSFRSTIQRRRIETEVHPGRSRRTFSLSEVQSREEGLKLVPCKVNEPVLLLSEVQSREEGLKRTDLFPAHDYVELSEVQSREEGLKRGLNPVVSTSNHRLSEVQSREEGLKRKFRFCQRFGRSTFRSTIQRRRIETIVLLLVTLAVFLFQKYNPEKKDWNVCSSVGLLYWIRLSEVQSREEGLKLG